MKTKQFCKIVLIPILFLALTSFSTLEYQTLRKARSLLLPDSHLQLRYLGAEMVQVMDELGRTLIKSMAEPTYQGKPAKKIIRFHIPDVDTSQMSGRFKLFATVPVGSEGTEAIVADTDNDSLREIIGMFKSFEMSGPEPVYNRIYEQIEVGSDSFMLVYDHFPELYSSPELATDINQNGLQELLFMVVDYESLGVNLIFYEGLSPGQLATKKIIIHRMFEQTGFKQEPRETDLDQDGIKEILYTGSEFADNENGYEERAYIAEYQHENRALERVWSVKYRELAGGGGNDKAIGDFDMDGKMEFVTSDGLGIVYWVEHAGADNHYMLSHVDTVSIWNTSFHTEGDDLDEDGRPECFIGGSGFTSHGYVNLITCFEGIGDNRYEKSVEIQITGVGGFNPEMFWQADIDGDHKKELVLSIGGTIIVLKVIGDDDYEIFWLIQYFNEVLGTIGDVNGDGIDDILRARKDRKEGKWAFRTDLYIFNPTLNTVKSSKQSKSVPVSYELYPPYPNPFNGSVRIAWDQKFPDGTCIIIYNLKGHKVKTLANKVYSAGYNYVDWDGTNDKGLRVSSGIYVCQINIGTLLKYQKLTLAK